MEIAGWARLEQRGRGLTDSEWTSLRLLSQITGEPFHSSLELLRRSTARQAVLPAGEVAMAGPACLSLRIPDLRQRLVGGCIQSRKCLLCSPDQNWSPSLDEFTRMMFPVLSCPGEASVPGQPTGCLDPGPPDLLSLLGAQPCGSRRALPLGALAWMWTTASWCGPFFFFKQDATFASSTLQCLCS